MAYRHRADCKYGDNIASMAWGASKFNFHTRDGLREADAEFSRAVAANPSSATSASLGFLQLDLVRAYCALRRASSVDDAERRLAARARNNSVKRL